MIISKEGIASQCNQKSWILSTWRTLVHCGKCWIQKEGNKRRYLLNIRKHNEKVRLKSFIKEQKLLNLNKKGKCSEKDKLGAERFPIVGTVCDKSRQWPWLVRGSEHSRYLILYQRSPSIKCWCAPQIQRYNLLCRFGFFLK